MRLTKIFILILLWIVVNSPFLAIAQEKVPRIKFEKTTTRLWKDTRGQDI